MTQAANGREEGTLSELPYRVAQVVLRPGACYRFDPPMTRAGDSAASKKAVNFRHYTLATWAAWPMLAMAAYTRPPL